jgi:RNA polymerase sigma-70 factor (ECF subfamily)
MHTTSASLLERLRDPREQDAWTRFVRLYTPMIYSWACRTGLPAQDACDLVQDVFTLLVQKLPEFVYDRQRSFRGWLHKVTLNKRLERVRRRAGPFATASDSALAALADQESDETFSEVEYRHHVVGRALQIMQMDFEPATWKACWEYVVAGRSATDVAEELGVTVDVVYAAKSRVLRRLRQELDQLWE